MNAAQFASQVFSKWPTRLLGYHRTENVKRWCRIGGEYVLSTETVTTILTLKFVNLKTNMFWELQSRVDQNTFKMAHSFQVDRVLNSIFAAIRCSLNQKRKSLFCRK